MKIYLRIAALAMIAALAGCIYPPMTEPPSDEQQRVVIPLPYDLAWDAVNSVIQENGLRIQAQDSNHGIIEAVGPRFTLHDADCGKIKSVVGLYAAEPEPNATSVYNFLVRPHGKEASVVDVRATFNSPVKVPLRPTKDVDSFAQPGEAAPSRPTKSPSTSTVTRDTSSTVEKSLAPSRFSISPGTPPLVIHNAPPASP